MYDFPPESQKRPFKRPTHPLMQLVNRYLLPPQPEDQTVYEFGDIRKQMKLRHHVISTLVVAVILSYGYGLYLIAPFLLQSPLTLTVELLDFLPVYLLIPSVVAVTIGWFAIPSRATIPRMGGFLDRFAVLEEQWFREGSEHWTKTQRVKSALGFGLIHIANFIYPFGAVLVLTPLGLWLNSVYLHQHKQTGSRELATLESSLMHRCFNRMVLCWFFIIIFWDVLKDIMPFI